MVDIALHFDLVARLARRVKAKLPPSVELDDLVQEGKIGLMQAAERYDASRGVPFQAYAERRIVGQMLSICRRKNYAYEFHVPLYDTRRDTRITADTNDTGRGFLADIERRLSHTPDPVATIDADRRAALVRSALVVLPQWQRDMVIEYAKGSDFRSIGRKRRKSGVWAAYTLRRAFELLKQSKELRLLS